MGVLNYTLYVILHVHILPNSLQTDFYNAIYHPMYYINKDNNICTTYNIDRVIYSSTP
jgi:hypothetical protein